MSVQVALDAVVALHQPLRPPAEHQWLGGGNNPHCTECDGGGDPYQAQDWPCDTIKAVTAGLGVEPTELVTA